MGMSARLLELWKRAQPKISQLHRNPEAAPPSVVKTGPMQRSAVAYPQATPSTGIRSGIFSKLPEDFLRRLFYPQQQEESRWRGPVRKLADGGFVQPTSVADWQAFYANAAKSPEVQQFIANAKPAPKINTGFEGVIDPKQAYTSGQATLAMARAAENNPALSQMLQDIRISEFDRLYQPASTASTASLAVEDVPVKVDPVSIRAAGATTSAPQNVTTSYAPSSVSSYAPRNLNIPAAQLNVLGTRDLMDYVSNYQKPVPANFAEGGEVQYAPAYTPTGNIMLSPEMNRFLSENPELWLQAFGYGPKDLRVPVGDDGDDSNWMERQRVSALRNQMAPEQLQLNDLAFGIQQKALGDRTEEEKQVLRNYYKQQIGELTPLQIIEKQQLQRAQQAEEGGFGPAFGNRPGYNDAFWKGVYEQALLPEQARRPSFLGQEPGFTPLYVDPTTGQRYNLENYANPVRGFGARQGSPLQQVSHINYMADLYGNRGSDEVPAWLQQMLGNESVVKNFAQYGMQDPNAFREMLYAYQPSNQEGTNVGFANMYNPNNYFAQAQAKAAAEAEAAAAAAIPPDQPLEEEDTPYVAPKPVSVRAGGAKTTYAPSSVYTSYAPVDYGTSPLLNLFPKDEEEETPLDPISAYIASNPLFGR